MARSTPLSEHRKPPFMVLATRPGFIVPDCRVNSPFEPDAHPYADFR